MANKTEVLVIGGGAIGLCTAYYLQRAGRQVTLIDKGPIGGACSAGNAGLLVPSHFVPLASPGIVAQGLKWMFSRKSPFYIKPRFSLSLLSWLHQFRAHCNEANVRKGIPVLHQLITESMNLFGELEHEEGVQLERKGMLMLFHSLKGEQGCLALAERARRVGLPMAELDRTALLELEPNVRTAADGAVYFKDDAHLDPVAFMCQIEKQLRGAGASVLGGTEALMMERKGDRISRVATSAGDFEADEVVLAGGAWSPPMVRDLGLNMPVQAGKGYSLTLGGSPQAPTIPMILSEEKVTVTPLGDSLRFAGTLELAGLDDRVNRNRADAILSIIPEYIPGFDASTVASHAIWSGFRPCTPDGLPLIGRPRGFSNFTIAAGHAMIGITLAPVTGRMVADLLDGTTHEAMPALSPNRWAAKESRRAG